MDDTCYFPTAFVFQRNQGSSQECNTISYLAISCGIYWMPVTASKKPPTSLLSFKKKSYLSLERLPNDSSWSRVEAIVSQSSTRLGPAVVIEVPRHRRIFRSSSPTELVLVAKDEIERDGWLHTCRLHITPWEVLESRMKAIANSLPVSITLESLAMKISELTSVQLLRRASGSPLATCPSSGNIAQEALESIKDYEFSADVFKAYPDFVGVVAITTKQFLKESISKIAEAGDEAAKVATNIAEATRIVSVVSSGFQVIALTLRLVAMAGEVKRGREVLPYLCTTARNLLASIPDSLPLLIHPSTTINPILVTNVFKFQEESLQALEKVEAHLMRGPVRQYVWTRVVRESEYAVQELQEKIVGVLNTVEVAKCQASHTSKLPVIRNRPRSSSFFVGRDEELLSLKSKLDKFASAAITQYGGAGKTELMTAFAENAESQGWISNKKTYWISARGTEAQFLSALATFAEALCGGISEKDSNDFNALITVLQGVLGVSKAKWLLCLDNADNKEVNWMVGEICNLADPKANNGWVLVTSRQNHVNIWEEMSREQRLLLGTLNLRFSKIALWRRKYCITKAECSDEEVFERIELLKTKNVVEFQSLEELAGVSDPHGLGGLCLALAQAGSYMYCSGDSFSEYIELYKSMADNQCVHELFNPIETTKQDLRSQRSIWTTWKINIDALGDTAKKILRSFALFGSSPVPKLLVRNIDLSLSSELLFRKYVGVELVRNASLLQENQNEQEHLYGMHGVIRRFIIHDMRKEIHEYENAIKRAVSALHDCAKAIVGSGGQCINDPPYFCGKYSVNFAPNAQNVLKIIFANSHLISEPVYQEKVIHISFFTISAFRYNQRSKEALPVCEGLCDILQRESWKRISNKLLCEATFQRGHIALINSMYGVANESYQNVIDLRRNGTMVSSNDFYIANAYLQLGRVAEEKGELLNAERFYLQSHDMYCELEGDGDCRATASVLHQLGAVALRRGSLAEAESFYKRSLEMEHRMYGEDADYDHIATSLYQMGRVALKRFNLRDADQWFHRSLEMEKRIYGQSHDSVSISATLHQLGMVAQAKGNLSEAETLYQQSNEMLMRLVGEKGDYAECATGYYDQGSIEEERGNLKDAEKLSRKAVDIGMKLAGDEGNADVAQSLNQLGRILLQIGELSEAESRINESLTIMQKLNNNSFDHPNVAESLHQIGKIAEERSEWQLAEEKYNKSLRMERRMKGEDVDHPAIASILRSMGSLCFKRGQFNEGAQKLKSSAEMYRRIFDGSDHRVIKAEKELKDLQLLYC